MEVARKTAVEDMTQQFFPKLHISKRGLPPVHQFSSYAEGRKTKIQRTMAIEKK